MFRITTAFVLATALVVALPGELRRSQSSAFAEQIAALSEPGGYFDTDNLISNERAYLHVLPDLDRRQVRGGAYLGVGPDQNFSYIAAIRPSMAFIVDIRRDNLLLHLLFKAIFDQAGSRVEYLALLFGRRVPADVAAWRQAPIDRLADYITRNPADTASLAATRQRLQAVMKGFGVPLSSEDLSTIDRFHRRFIDGGLQLQFESTGRPPQRYYPTYGDLLLEDDGAGRQRHYLASDESFQFVKSLEAHDRVIPVVGDLSGSRALPAIARLLAQKGEPLSAVYASNVEFYLERDGSYRRFLSNLAQMPRTRRTVIIRSIFNRGFGGSTSELQPVDDLLSQTAVPR